jgi:hypothetical protein
VVELRAAEEETSPNVALEVTCGVHTQVEVVSTHAGGVYGGKDGGAAGVNSGGLSHAAPGEVHAASISATNSMARRVDDLPYTW